MIDLVKKKKTISIQELPISYRRTVPIGLRKQILLVVLILLLLLLILLYIISDTNIYILFIFY